MLTLHERKQINAMLPTGVGKKIAAKTGISPISVSLWFQGKTNSERVENAVLDYLIESRKEAERKLKEAGFGV